MKRGSTIKRETDERLVLERRMITKRYVLELVRDKCIGCEICAAACPTEAVKLIRGTVEEGRLVEKPTIDISVEKCNFCGECVVLCPVNALQMTVDGEAKIPTVEMETFPTLIKEIAVEVEKCRPTCELACQESCPVECIEVLTERGPEGEITKIVDVKINREECIYCVQCEVACPEGAISVVKPYEGIILLDVARCPEGCQACVDVCPTDALQMKDGALILDERFCLYCGACQQVCPEEGAIVVMRHAILHTEIKSGAWNAALEKLTSVETVSRELDAKSRMKLRQAVKNLSAL